MSYAPTCPGVTEAHLIDCLKEAYANHPFCSCYEER